MDDLVSGRECGACQVCCIAPGIDEPEIQKQAGATCRHCVGGTCDIYDRRPAVCCKYFCGWRKLASLDEDWRPDKSGVLIESGNFSAFGATGIGLVLVGNPLKTIRQQRFLDFVGKNIAQNVPLFLSLPGPPGKASATVRLNTPEMQSAVTQSRAHTRLALEDVLRRLSGHDWAPYVITHKGNDVTT